MFAAYNDVPYSIMVFLHIATAFLAFAPVIVHQLLGAQIVRSNSSDRASIFSYMAQNSMRIYGGSLIVSGLLGFGVAGMSDEVFKMSQGWLIGAFIVWIAMNGVLHGGIVAAEKAIAAAGTNRDDAAEKKLQMASSIMTVLFLVQLYLMVFKPGLDAALR